MSFRFHVRAGGEVLSRQPIALVFCDRRLPDGSYRDLLEHAGSWRHASRVVVTSEAGDSVDQGEAAECGASGIVRFLFHATDVELLILRAAREGNQEVAPIITA